MTALLAIVVVVVALLLVVFGGMALWARRHPLEAWMKLTRRAFRRAGLSRREVAVSGGRIVYFAGGRGARTMVLVHGVNDQAGSWAGIVGRMTDRFRVVTVDLAGHGQSDPAMGPLSMPLMVEGLASIIDRESPDQPVVLVGNSMGGWVSMVYAADHPHRVEQLVLEDSSGMKWDFSHVNPFPKDRAEALRLLRMVHGPDAPIPTYLVDAMLTLAPTLPRHASWLPESMAG